MSWTRSHGSYQHPSSKWTQMRVDNASVFSPEMAAFMLGVAVQELWDALLGKCCNPAAQHIPGPQNLVHGNQLPKCATAASPLCHQFQKPLMPWLQWNHHLVPSILGKVWKSLTSDQTRFSVRKQGHGCDTPNVWKPCLGCLLGICSQDCLGMQRRESVSL